MNFFFLCVWLCHSEMVLFLSQSSVVKEWSHLMLAFPEIICITYETPWSSCKCHTPTSWELPRLLYFLKFLYLLLVTSLTEGGMSLYEGCHINICLCLNSLHLDNIFHEINMWPFSIWRWGWEVPTLNTIRHQCKGTYFLDMYSGYVERLWGMQYSLEYRMFWICIHALCVYIYIFAQSHLLFFFLFSFLPRTTFELCYFG